MACFFRFPATGHGDHPRQAENKTSLSAAGKALPTAVRVLAHRLCRQSANLYQTG
jgi:hypothetical protein